MSYEKIEFWLKENASKIYNSLNEPVKGEAFEKIEQEIGNHIPQEFKELYYWHNGLNNEDNMGSLFYGMNFLSLEAMMGYHRLVGKAEKVWSLKSADPEIKLHDLFNPNWLQFGDGGGHTSLYLDLSPTTTGNYGQIIFIDDEWEVGLLVAKSITAFIEQFTKDLEKGLYSLNEDGLADEDDEDDLVDKNHFIEPHLSIDLINWWHSERWSRDFLK